MEPSGQFYGAAQVPSCPDEVCTSQRQRIADAAIGNGGEKASSNPGRINFLDCTKFRFRRHMATLNALREESQRLVSVYERKLAAREALKKSLLHQAFSGELTATSMIKAAE